MYTEGDASTALLLFGALSGVVWLYHNHRRHSAPVLVTYEGSCHCEAVKFKVRAPYHLTVWDCNCSICLMKKNAHFIVPAKNLTLLSGESDITTYTFNTRKAKHYFCKHCGVQSFYVSYYVILCGRLQYLKRVLHPQVPRSNPDGFGVTLACVRGVQVRRCVSCRGTTRHGAFYA